MDTCVRNDPPFGGPEKPMLAAFLNWQRATLLCKLDGLSDEDLRRPHVPSGLTLLGLVKHLANVERSWFREVFAGEDLSGTWDPQDPDRYWRIEPEETTDQIVAFYQGEVERARVIVRNADLDDLARSPRPDQPGMTLRWIVMHMIEETARHVGHADLMREAIDGQIGE